MRSKDPARRKDVQAAILMLNMLAGEHDRRGLHRTILTEAAVEQGLENPTGAAFALSWLGKGGWIESAGYRSGFWKLTSVGRELLAVGDGAEIARLIATEWARIDEQGPGDGTSRRRDVPPPEFVCPSCHLRKSIHQRVESGTCRDCE